MIRLSTVIGIIIIALAVNYTCCKSERHSTQDTKYDSIRTHLLNQYTSDAILKETRPILWIHVPHEYNTRKWYSFGSRSSLDLNQPYMLLTARSIIRRCNDSFKICFIDDSSFPRLLKDWPYDMDQLASPTVSIVRRIGLAQILYLYGGMCLPLSFLCFDNLDALFKQGTRNNRPFVVENRATSVQSADTRFSPDADWMGAPKQCPVVAEYIQVLQNLAMTDMTAQPTFEGYIETWCEQQISARNMNIIAGTRIGTRTLANRAVLVDDLLTEAPIDFDDSMYGIYIPASDILGRKAYEWFARLSPTEIFGGTFILAKYFVLAFIPVKEGMEDRVSDVVGDSVATPAPSWIHFWRVPDGSPVWGLMPMYLGNNVPKIPAYKLEY